MNVKALAENYLFKCWLTAFNLAVPTMYVTRNETLKDLETVTVVSETASDRRGRKYNVLLFTVHKKVM